MRQDERLKKLERQAGIGRPDPPPFVIADHVGRPLWIGTIERGVAKSQDFRYPAEGDSGDV
jgi:hypothetical protein